MVYGVRCSLGDMFLHVIMLFGFHVKDLQRKACGDRGLSKGQVLWMRVQVTVLNPVAEAEAQTAAKRREACMPARPAFANCYSVFCYKVRRLSLLVPPWLSRKG